MPTYEYACTDCRERHEVVQRFTDASLTVCPACTGTLRKVFSPVGVVFKGSGFYKTDSRRSSGGSSSREGGSGSGADSGRSETKSDSRKGSGDDAVGSKTESKPAAKTDTGSSGSSGSSSSGSSGSSGSSSSTGSRARPAAAAS